jgi:hypothetical protein
VPIQEDETALVIWALWQHYDEISRHRIRRKFYRPLITKAPILCEFRTKIETPRLRGILWEDRRGIHTFTCFDRRRRAAGGGKFRRFSAKRTRAKNMKPRRRNCRRNARTSLQPELGRFLRALQFHGDEHFSKPTRRLTLRFSGSFYFGAFDARRRNGSKHDARRRRKTLGENANRRRRAF